MRIVTGAVPATITAAGSPARPGPLLRLPLCPRAPVFRIRLALLLFGIIVSGAWALGQQKPPAATGKDNPFRELDSKTILVISPHPEDDIVGCGGALAFLSGRKNRVVTVFLSAGEKGTLDPHMSTDLLKTYRVDEATAGYRTLGFSDAEFVWLNYAHGELDSVPPGEVRERLVQIIRKRRPDIVFSMDPLASYTRYEEPDHRAGALLAADAIRAAQWPHQFPKAGPPYGAPEVYFYSPAEPNVKLDISPMYERKLASLMHHATQFSPALNHISHGRTAPPPARLDVAARMRNLYGATTVELFRRR